MSEVTVGIPTYNCAMYLPYVLSKLKMQKIPNLPVIVYDNGSTDGTVGFCSEWFMNNHFKQNTKEENNLNFSFFAGLHDPSKEGWVNGQMTRKLIAKLVQTKYVFFLDPDVLIRPLVLLRMLDQFREKNEDGRLAYVGLEYDPTLKHPDPEGFSHIQMGATLWLTDVFKQIPECTNKDIKPPPVGHGCDCNFCFAQVRKLGYRGVHVDKLRAEHLHGVFT